MKKLRLNKEKIAQLSEDESSFLLGGGTANSTNRGFTCCWCTGSTVDETQCVTAGTCVSTQNQCPPRTKINELY